MSIARKQTVHIGICNKILHGWVSILTYSGYLLIVLGIVLRV